MNIKKVATVLGENNFQVYDDNRAYKGVSVESFESVLESLGEHNVFRINRSDDGLTVGYSIRQLVIESPDVRRPGKRAIEEAEESPVIFSNGWFRGLSDTEKERTDAISAGKSTLMAKLGLTPEEMKLLGVSM